MRPKIGADHLARGDRLRAAVNHGAGVGNLESQRRQYDLAYAASKAGLNSVTVIDDDLGRSGSGTI